MPDSAFILRAYKRWGEDAASHLLGDFAFAIWDGRKKELVLARDHMGQRYVHYHHGQDFFAFATEIKALWAVPDVPRELNEHQLGRYLLLDFRVRDGATLFRDIFGLAGGTTMVIRNDGTRSMRGYWEPHAAPEHIGREEAYYVETYRRVLAEAVECRIRRLNAPPALLLSGGFDSTGIAAMCGPVLTSQGRTLITLSSVLPETYSGPRNDVRQWIECCRRHMPHIDVRYFVRDADAFNVGLDRACAAADEIPTIVEFVHEGLFRMAAAAGSRFVMDGMGGDSTLNPRGAAALAFFLRSGHLRRFVSELFAHRRVTGDGWSRIARGKIIFPLTPVWARRMWWALRRNGPMRAIDFVAPKFYRDLTAARALDLANRPAVRWGASIRRMNMRVLRTIARRPRCLQGNEAATRGLDIARPMLDKRVVEFGLAIPQELYVVHGRDRYLACRAMADAYPREYQTRKSSAEPFDPDTVETLWHALPSLRAQLERLRDHEVLRDYFNFAGITEMFSIKSQNDIVEDGMISLAARATRAAHYVAWFRNENR